MTDFLWSTVYWLFIRPCVFISDLMLMPILKTRVAGHISNAQNLGMLIAAVLYTCTAILIGIWLVK